MNYDDFNSDPEPQEENQHHLLDDNFDDENDGGWNRERSPATPVHDDFKAKPRKRLIKKSGGSEPSSNFRLRDEDGDDYGVGVDDDVAGLVRDESEDGGMPSSSSGGGGGSGLKRKKLLGKESGGGERRKEKRRSEGKGEKKFQARKMGGGRSRDREGDREMKEMWETVAGEDSKVCSLFYLSAPFSFMLYHVIFFL